MATSTFAARFPGGCLACEGRISPGELVKWADDSVVHADCPVLDDNLRPAPPVCPSCHMVPASNGACDCDDTTQEN
ncbi:MAG: hypothetical protein JWP31_1807 [Aeromicrobium sp.]|nr:hypothetical protein [Aeromicrobium sp.]